MEDNIKKRMNKEERRKQILESALSIFVDKGYNGATTLDISKEADISEVTLYRYFDSKKQIFMEAIKPILVTGLEEPIVASEDLKPKEKLKFILKNRIKFISSHHEVIKLILMESQINPEMADFNYINQIILILKDSFEEADIELDDEDFLVRILMGSMLSFLYMPEANEEKINSYVNGFIYSFIKNNK